MDTLFDVPEVTVNHVTGEDLREEIHRHLMKYPHLTAFEIARALHLERPGSTGYTRVRRQLLLMEDDGEAEKTTGPRSAGDHRTAVRWVAT